MSCAGVLQGGPQNRAQAEPSEQTPRHHPFRPKPAKSVFRQIPAVFSSLVRSTRSKKNADQVRTERAFGQKTVLICENTTSSRKPLLKVLARQRNKTPDPPLKRPPVGTKLEKTAKNSNLSDIQENIRE